MPGPFSRLVSAILAALVALPGFVGVPTQVQAGPTAWEGGWLERPAHRSGLGAHGVHGAPGGLQGGGLRSWMHPGIAEAWGQGFRGQGTVMLMVDDFRPGGRIVGDLGTGRAMQGHGAWVQSVAGLLAPEAAIITQDFTSGVFSTAWGWGGRLPDAQVPLVEGPLTTINLSYAMFTAAGVDPSRIAWGGQEASIISHAVHGRAVVVKAAGNDAVAVGAPNADGRVDQLNLALVGAPSAIFVGALSRHGSTEAPAALAAYSNRAGDDPAVQARFLVAGVPGHLTGLYGTSFAAPVVSAYASVLGSKFTTATPEQIANRLLETARTDTILGYAPSLHGRGEASIARALAPVTIH